MRKKAGFVILAVIFLFILTGCKAIKKAVAIRKPDLDRAFSCGVKISAFEDMELEGKMSRLGTGMWEMEIDSPETMAGTRLSYDENGVKAVLGELSFDIPAEKVNEDAVFRLIFTAVDNFAALPEAGLSETEQGYIYSGDIPQSAYQMTFDKETSELTAIDFPDKSIAVCIIKE